MQIDCANLVITPQSTRFAWAPKFISFVSWCLVFAIGSMPGMCADGSGHAAITIAESQVRPTAAAASEKFVEDFTKNIGLNRFRRGVYHRNIGAQELGQEPVIWGDNNAIHGGSWTGDHDLGCGSPDTQRSLTSTKQKSGLGRKWVPLVDFNIQEIFYLCRYHMMSSMGDIDGYSIAWFSPKRQFSRDVFKKVSWDVNVTDLLARQWWEVSIIPSGTKFLTTVSMLAGTAGTSEYDVRSVVIGSGPFGSSVNITTQKKNRYNGLRPLCGRFGLDPRGCSSKRIRRPFSIRDNGDGTLTVNYGGLFTGTVPGRFPDKFEVYFADHNYTPDKDGKPVGHTWHWDNIRVE